MELKIHKDANSFFNALPKHIRNPIWAFIQSVLAQKEEGKPLGKHRKVGDLTHCYKEYFDKGRVRVVYRFYPSDSQPDTLYVLAIGDRNDFEVYHKAFEVQQLLKQERGWWP